MNTALVIYAVFMTLIASVIARAANRRRAHRCPDYRDRFARQLRTATGGD